VPSAPALAETLDLPDGRQLLVYADGSELVVGTARAYPHPVPGCEWRGPPPSTAVARWRPSSPPSSASLRRPIRIVPNERDFVEFQRDDQEANRRANALLDTLLRPEQRHDWHTTGGFWVDTPYGPVRLGRLYSLVHHPNDEPDVERILCVVPEYHLELPIADIWSNLLLVLAVEPDDFFRVAIERDRHRRRAAN